MAVFRDPPYPGFNFTVDLGDGNVEGPEAGLLEVILPEARLVTQEFRDGNEKTNESRLVQTGIQYSTLILRRGVNGSLRWYQWWNAFRNGDPTGLRNVTINLLNEDHTAVVLTWRLLRARPVNHQYSPLSALGGELFTESLELGFERLEME